MTTQLQMDDWDGIYIFFREQLNCLFQRMFHKQNSSSQEEDDNFEGHFKKIQYNGSAFDSEDNESMVDESQSVEDSRRGGKLKRKRDSQKEEDNPDKSKAIKKNRQSAKISRLRKKEYQDMLEQTVQELQHDIIQKKNNIRRTNERILAKFQQTNKEKYKYLVQKMGLSKKLLATTEDVRKLKQSEEPKLQKHLSEQVSEAIKVEDSQQQGSPQELGKSGAKDEHTKITRTRKKKVEVDHELEKTKQGDMLAEKEALLEMSIKTYMYEFGVRGCMRADIIERCKAEYLDAITQTCPQLSPEILQGLRGMKTCLQRIQSKTKALDYNLRQLKDRVKSKYVVQFILDRQFFINNSTDTIYKNSQLKKNNYN